MSRAGRFGKQEAMRRAQVEREQKMSRLGFMCHLSARGPQLPDPGLHGRVIADEMLQAALSSAMQREMNLQTGDKIWVPPTPSVSAA